MLIRCFSLARRHGVAHGTVRPFHYVHGTPELQTNHLLSAAPVVLIFLFSPSEEGVCSWCLYSRRLESSETRAAVRL